MLIEDILAIYINDHDKLMRFINWVIDEVQNSLKDAERPRVLLALTQINLYHRMLECLLYRMQNLIALSRDQESQALQGTIVPDQARTAELIRKVKSDIKKLTEKYEDRMDKHYMLFLFQIYQYVDGVKATCEKLNLRLQLLNFYISQNLPDRVLEVCKGTGIQMASIAAHN